MPNVLIVGATRGLGYRLAKQYAQREDSVTGTARSSKPKDAHHDIHWLTGVDISTESAGATIAAGLKGHKQDLVIITAGYFGKESLETPDYEAEVRMYKTSAIGPVFLVHHLHRAGLLRRGGKIVVVSSESGSITLRHESEGGGMEDGAVLGAEGRGGYRDGGGGAWGEEGGAAGALTATLVTVTMDDDKRC
ncbi:hypothetical protein LTR53_010390 [Teratosphaeriaceae sp. CCFEE 6253]|nr:hypothetical protein LTR53_010390 [Teratosphaeriaceae sp. CCFEE 6253]